LAAKQPARPRQPARGRGVPTIDAVLAREIRRQAAGPAGIAPALVSRVRLPAAINRCVALAQPPQ
jgi:hypothetical protein